MQPHIISDGSAVLTVPRVQQGINHSSVDLRHTNTQPSLPLIFIFDSSVKTTVFQYSTVFSIYLPCPIHSSLHISGTNERLLACLFPLYPSNLSRLLVLSLTDFWISSPHFSVKTLAGAFRSSFTNFSKCRWSLDVVFGGLPLRFAV